MDCLKNLTACQGCTKKHAKCSWKEVKEPELRASYQATASSAAPPASNAAYGSSEYPNSNSSASSAPPHAGGHGTASGFEDVDDEPASVGQRTPPPRANPNAYVPPTQYAYQHAQSASHAATPRDHHYASSQAAAPPAPMEPQVKPDDHRHAPADVEEQLQRAARLAEEEQSRQEAERQKREREHYESRRREYEAVTAPPAPSAQQQPHIQQVS